MISRNCRNTNGGDGHYGESLRPPSFMTTEASGRNKSNMGLYAIQKPTLAAGRPVRLDPHMSLFNPSSRPKTVQLAPQLSAGW